MTQSLRLMDMKSFSTISLPASHSVVILLKMEVCIGLLQKIWPLVHISLLVMYRLNLTLSALVPYDVIKVQIIPFLVLWITDFI